MHGRLVAPYFGCALLCLALVAGCQKDTSDAASAPEAQQPQAKAVPAAQPRPANPGVFPDRLVLGMNAVFSGPSAGLGVEMWRGASAAFAEANARGGVHGRRIELRLADDKYEADSAAPAVAKLIVQENVFNTGWSVGTPTMVKALPVILQYHRTEGLFHFGNFTGAQPQRNPPYDNAVFNIRASYRQETAAIVEQFLAAGKQRVGVFIQDDAYGADGMEGAKRALQKHGRELVATARYKRGQAYDADNAAAVKILRDAKADAVIMVGSYQACAGFIRDARLQGWTVPVHNVSFVGPEQLLGYLLAEEKKRGKPIVTNIINTLVVPHYEETSLPMVAQYRAAMDKFNPQTPTEAQHSGYKPDYKYSFGSLEGYITARTYLAIVERVGRDLTRKAFATAAESMGEFDMGLGAPMKLAAGRHQALDKVWFAHATQSGWKPLQPPLVAVLR